MAPILVPTPEQQKRHEELFKQNHILAPLSTNKIPVMSRIGALKAEASSLDRPQHGNDPFNDTADSSFSSQLHLTPLKPDEVENNPKTPGLRDEFKRNKQGADTSFSPAQPTTTKRIVNFNSPGDNGFKSSLIKVSLTNRSSTSGSGSSTPDFTDLSSQTPSHVNLPKGPSSILKKAHNINYDRETSMKLLQKRPDLATALNEAGELNPLKAAKRVVVSPKKEIIPTWKSLPKGTRFSSPLVDGKLVSVRSPFTRASPKKKKSEPKESDWVDDEKEGKSPTKKNKKKKESPGLFKTVLASLIDPQLPYILSLYLQLLFNVVIVSILLYFVCTFISTVKADVENKVDSYAADIIQEIEFCRREYNINGCGDPPAKRAPALRPKCSEWEKCMKRNPETVGRAQVSAETFAEIINGFMKPISWKSIFFLLLITVGSLALTNAAFGTYRNYHGHQDPRHTNVFAQQVPQTPGVPQTPHQTPYRSLQMNPQYTKYYTPAKPLSPVSGALTKRVRSTRKLKK